MTESPKLVATCRNVRPHPVDLLILLGVTGIEVSQSPASAFRIHPTLRYVVGVADRKLYEVRIWSVHLDMIAACHVHL